GRGRESNATDPTYPNRTRGSSAGDSSHYQRGGALLSVQKALFTGRAADSGGVSSIGVDRDRSEAPTEATRYLTFTLQGDAYALDIFHVTEILEHRPLTTVPMTPDFIRGVINLRGRAVPVIDLSLRFGHAATAIG